MINKGLNMTTYRDLLDFLTGHTDEQLDQPVRFYLSNQPDGPVQPLPSNLDMTYTYTATGTGDDIIIFIDPD